VVVHFKSLLAVVVLMSSKYMFICKRFHAKLVDINKNRKSAYI